MRIFYILLLFALGFSQVSLEIKNVDTDDAGCTDPDYNTQETCEAEDADWYTGTLDIYMSNTSGCSYCAEWSINKNTNDWYVLKKYCEKTLDQLFKVSYKAFVLLT